MDDLAEPGDTTAPVLGDGGPAGRAVVAGGTAAGPPPGVDGGLAGGRAAAGAGAAGRAGGGRRVAGRAAGRARGRSRVRRNQGLAAWGFALPFVLLFATFVALPVLSSFFFSFTDLRSSDLRHPFAVNFTGLRNYSRLLSDDVFRQAALNTVYFVGVGVPLTMCLALAIAVALNSGVNRLRTFFRVGYYLPVVTSIVAIAVLWRFILEPTAGLLNQLLGLVGVTGPNWVGSKVWAMPSIIAMATWRNVGFLMVIFLAGLQAIPAQLYEAADVDGASGWSRFRFVTLPMLRPTLLFGAVITGIGYLQFFEEPFVLTQGKPLNKTLSVSYDIYNQFGFGNYGYAAAMSYVLFAAIVLLTLLQFRLLGRRVDEPASGRR
ncbi:MAG: multiple sugar transport system permease protein [Mycobacteriales bacterium]